MRVMKRSWFSKGNQPRPPQVAGFYTDRLAGVHSTKLMSASAKRAARAARLLDEARRGGIKVVDE